MRKWIALGCAVLLAVCWVAQATMVGGFPGLDALIAEADAIVILRVEDELEPRSKFGQSGPYSCYIYQSLKGNIAANNRVVVNLFDMHSLRFPYDFSEGSTLLVFLHKLDKPVGEANYVQVLREGSYVQVDPIGNEKKPEGETLHDQIVGILKHTMTYNEKQFKKEQAFLQKLIAGKEMDAE